MDDYLGASTQAPHRSDVEVEQEASTFLDRYWDGQIPVDVEKICDDMGIRIVYVPDVKRLLGADAFVSSDFSIITVDKECALRYENRFRFSVAHELGHVILHREYYPSGICDISSYLSLSGGLVDRRMEHEANQFAAAVLMPPSNFKSHLNNFFGQDVLTGARNKEIKETNEFLFELTKAFAVSKDALSWRLKYLCPDLVRELVSRG